MPRTCGPVPTVHMVSVADRASVQASSDPGGPSHVSDAIQTRAGVLDGNVELQAERWVDVLAVDDEVDECVAGAEADHMESAVVRRVQPRVVDTTSPVCRRREPIGRGAPYPLHEPPIRGGRWREAS